MAEETAAVDDEDVGEVGAERDKLAEDDIGVTTGGVLVLADALALGVEVKSSVMVWVSTTVTGGDVMVVTESTETTETSVSIAVTVLVASLTGEAVIVTLSVVVFVSGDGVTVLRTVVACFVLEVPPSMGTIEYRGLRA